MGSGYHVFLWGCFCCTIAIQSVEIPSKHFIMRKEKKCFMSISHTGSELRSQKRSLTQDNLKANSYAALSKLFSQCCCSYPSKQALSLSLCLCITASHSLTHLKSLVQVLQTSVQVGSPAVQVQGNMMWQQLTGERWGPRAQGLHGQRYPHTRPSPALTCAPAGPLFKGVGPIVHASSSLSPRKAFSHCTVWLMSRLLPWPDVQGVGMAALDTFNAYL